MTDIDRAAADHLLTTTRTVRKRLDLSREVPRELILECVAVSQQAPTGSNLQGWRWLIVTDPTLKAGLADIYQRGGAERFATAHDQFEAGSATSRVRESAMYLADHLREVPALVIPCIKGRVNDMTRATAAEFYGSIYPAVWSFMLAARARGLGTALTTLHLIAEAEAAALLGIPDDVVQAALIPLAYYTGDTFSPVERPPAEWITSWDRWGNKD